MTSPMTSTLPKREPGTSWVGSASSRLVEKVPLGSLAGQKKDDWTYSAFVPMKEVGEK